MKGRPVVFLSVAIAACLVVSRARASDIELGAAAGPSAGASTWRGDYDAGSTLRAGARFSHVVAGDFQVWESYATVNHRANTCLSIGVSGFLPFRDVHPFGRLFALHQHEEGLVSVANAPVGAGFGIGSGIRHRAGGGLTLGAEIPFRKTDDRRLDWIFFVEGTSLYFPDSTLGPTAYFSIEAGVGLDYLLR